MISVLSMFVSTAITGLTNSSFLAAWIQTLLYTKLIEMNALLYDILIKTSDNSSSTCSWGKCGIFNLFLTSQTEVSSNLMKFASFLHCIAGFVEVVVQNKLVIVFISENATLDLNLDDVTQVRTGLNS